MFRSPTTEQKRRLLHDIYSSDYAIVIIAILAAISVRFLVISTDPTFLLGGDTPGYVAYTREIIQNGFAIPATNSIHFPGSIWVYPPILPYFWALVVSHVGNSAMSPFYIIEISGIVIDSLVVIPVFKIANLVFGRRAAVISIFLFTAYLPDLFALTWGGVPQLFATFLFAWVIYFTILISREGTGNKRNMLALGAILFVLTFTHDLTIFVMIFSLICIIAASIILRFIRIGGFRPDRGHLASVSWKLPVSILMAIPALLIWYLPRMWWLLDAGAPYIKSELITVSPSRTGLGNVLYQGINGYFSPLGFAIFLIPVAVYGIYLSFRNGAEKTAVLLMFVFAPMLLGALDFRDPIIVARLGYYTFLPGLIVAAYAFSRMTPERAGSGTGIIQKFSRKKVPVAAIMIPVILVAGLGVSQNMYSHTFYNSYLSENPGHVIDYASLKWIHTHLPQNSTIASFGEYGYYIMGYDGNPTLVYQNLKYLTQPAEWNESLAAYSLVYEPTHNVSQTMNLINSYNVEYVACNSGTSVPQFYNEVYHDSRMVIYQV